MSTAEAARVSAPLDARADVSAERSAWRSICAGSCAEQIVGHDVVDVGLDGVGEEERLAQPGQPVAGMHEHVEEVGELVRCARCRCA